MTFMGTGRTRINVGKLDPDLQTDEVIPVDVMALMVRIGMVTEQESADYYDRGERLSITYDQVIAALYRVMKKEVRDDS